MQENEQEPKFGAYGFLTLVDPGASVADAIQAYREMAAVTFANAFVGGSFDGFAAVKSDSFAEIQTLITGPARRSGVRTDWSILVQAAGRILAPHKTSPEPSPPRYESITRVRTGPRQASAVLEAIDSTYEEKITTNFVAHAAIVTGREVDILVELVSSSLEPLQESIVNDLAVIEGIVASDTSFAYIEG
jgi:DNA-binding Lrp family transcriptional regulator